MLLLRHRPTAAAQAPEPTDRAERSHTLVPLVDPIAPAWPSHARRCLGSCPSGCAGRHPCSTPSIPASSTAPPSQARELLLWLHHRPSYELLPVGCHPRRPA